MRDGPAEAAPRSRRGGLDLRRRVEHAQFGAVERDGVVDGGAGDIDRAAQLAVRLERSEVVPHRRGEVERALLEGEPSLGEEDWGAETEERQRSAEEHSPPVAEELVPHAGESARWKAVAEEREDPLRDEDARSNAAALEQRVQRRRDALEDTFNGVHCPDELREPFRVQRAEAVGRGGTGGNARRARPRRHRCFRLAAVLPAHLVRRRGRCAKRRRDAPQPNQEPESLLGRCATPDEVARDEVHALHVRHARLRVARAGRRDGHGQHLRLEVAHERVQHVPQSVLP